MIIHIKPVLSEVAEAQIVDLRKIREKRRVAVAFFLNFFDQALHLTVFHRVLLKVLKS